MAAAARSLPAPPGPGQRHALVRRRLLLAAERAGPGAAARSWEGGSCAQEGQECGGTIVPRRRGLEGRERKWTGAAALLLPGRGARREGGGH